MLIPESVIRIAGISPHQIYQGMVLRLLAQMFAVLPFFLTWFAIQWLLEGAASASDWWLMAVMMAGCLAGQLWCSQAGQMACFIGTYTMMKRYREAVTDHLRLMPLGYFQTHLDGSLATLLTDDMKRLEEIFTHLVAEVVAALSVPLFFSLILLVIDWRLTVSLLITLPLAWLLLWMFKAYLLQKSAQQSGNYQQASGLLVEYVAGIRILRSLNRSDWMLNRLEKLFEQIRKGSIGIELSGGVGVLLFRLMAEMGMVTLLLCGAWLFTGQSLDVVTWLLFILVSWKIIEALLEAGAFITQLTVMRQSANRLEALMNQPVMAEDTGVAIPEDLTIGFCDVGFRYQNEWVLRDINLTMPVGSVTAIVGPSGSGKSTLLHLLGRFFDPQEGRITLGGIDLPQLGTRSLYEHIGFVFQNVQLFDGTVLDNVRIGCPGASDELVFEACRQANCDEFIQQMEQGYHTMLGEGGLRLSGGERQRLSIARMWLKNPRIILLDEATASVDPCAQADIQRSLSQLAQGRTVVMIAHRLRTVEYADQILVMDHGRVVESGRHEELLKLHGLYWRLWNEQNSHLYGNDNHCHLYNN
ncbi:ABC transporter ATP-binding protein [Salmonella enterica subsp. enterica serovar Javiana]|nr:ABC transporter ATP-binding protein [Salmonella enterica]ECL4818270.1 ABC transporter ATP-binding protein [Salmonella enterica]EHA1743115.1 ABC transporter ATP-binding protein [Salmonella enterica subsp. enterica serovar Javiana]EHJ8320773.1 ABC transporter ATP-binding protein [Salmonella enterica subsp. enterica serovar Infantis]ELD4653734.1 ABC transporter ATP-binding protein [Salmonella enterica subsp. enterica serovar Javiana]